MSAVTTREALAKALCRSRDGETEEREHYIGHSFGDPWPCQPCVEEADYLIASGAVVDVATLADDEALVNAVSDIAYRGRHLSATHVRVLLLTVAKALTERAS